MNDKTVGQAIAKDASDLWNALLVENFDTSMGEEVMPGDNLYDRFTECEHCDAVIPYPQTVCGRCLAQLKQQILDDKNGGTGHDG